MPISHLMNPFRGLTPAVTDPGSWVELDRTTLVSSNNDIDVTNFANKKYLTVLGFSTVASNVNDSHRLGNGGSIDTGTNYANRRSIDGATDSTFTADSRLVRGAYGGGAGVDVSIFFINNILNPHSDEKFSIYHSAAIDVEGAGTAPNRNECVGKWSDTSDHADSYQWEAGGSTFDTDGEVVVLGWDESDTHTTDSNFWKFLGQTTLGSAGDNITVSSLPSRKYLLVEFFAISSGNVGIAMRFNGDTANNYNRRGESDGATPDNTQINQPYINMNSGAAVTTYQYGYAYIINVSSEEKLIIAEITKGATIPTRYEGIGKWVNKTDAIDEITIHNFSTGDFDTNSYLKVWGAN